jgi:hypothetical protein
LTIDYVRILKDAYFREEDAAYSRAWAAYYAQFDQDGSPKDCGPHGCKGITGHPDPRGLPDNFEAYVKLFAKTIPYVIDILNEEGLIDPNM